MGDVSKRLESLAIFLHGKAMEHTGLSDQNASLGLDALYDKRMALEFQKWQNAVNNARQMLQTIHGD
jgi:hypothetical protein